MEERIVIMGGSFNPPTIAHFELMKTALDELGAECGIYIPVGYAYLKRKMARNNSTFCLSEELRYQMLECMCADDPRMCVSKLEYGIPNGSTYVTLTEIQKQNPDAELYFIMGTDKISLMHDFALKSDYFKHFFLAVFSRDGVDAEQMIMNDPVLSPYAERFAFLSARAEYASVSSTIIRESMEQDKDYSEYVHPSVGKLLKTVRLEDFQEEIIRFKGEYEFLSNLFQSPIEWEGITYPCVESAFQASKEDDIEFRQHFAKCRSDKIKEKGNKLPVSDEWKDKQLIIMKNLLMLKFQTDPELAERLKATENKILINGNKGNDNFWGTSLYSWDGENNLGKLLMEVRDEI